MDLIRTCRVTGKEFVVPEAEQDLLNRIPQLYRVIKEPLPLPKIHPFEYWRRYACFYNDTLLYKGTSALSGKPTLSTFAPNSELKICTVDEISNDEVDNIEFGRPYDFSRPFFEQWYDVYRACYHLPVWNIENDNSDYVSGTMRVKDCYLCFTAVESVNSMYCLHLLSSNDCVDCLGTVRSQYCYGCVDVQNCYECRHCQDCENCHECFGSRDLKGCRNCFGCVGLRHLSYCIYNEQKSKAEFEEFMFEQNLGHKGMCALALDKCANFIAAQDRDVNLIVACEDSSGAYLKHCKNAVQCFQGESLVDCGYVAFGYNSKDCWRSSVLDAELAYGSNAINCRGSLYSSGVEGGDGCISCFNVLKGCSHCFGCVMLRNKSYCILNRQYSKEEYFDLVPRIIEQRKAAGDWGEFFPAEYAPFPYAASCVDEWLAPLEPAEIKRRGYRVDSLIEPEPLNKGQLDAELLPQNIADVQAQQVLGKAIRCKQTGRSFNFQRSELDFYKKYNIPLPDTHWRTRIHQMIAKRQLMPAV